MTSRSRQDLPSLVYRDDVDLKHMSKARLKGELVRLSTELGEPEPSRPLQDQKVDFRIEMLVKHMAQVGRASQPVL